jgi:hypothetical protein
MDNTNSQATINVPQLPSNVESLVGTSKTDLLNYVREMIAGSQISGINEAGPQSLDINAINSKITAVENDVAALNLRKPLKTSASGVNSAVVTVPLPETLDSNLYDVNMVFVGGSGAMAAGLRWSVVSGSKTTSQFQVRIDGDATALGLDFTITPTANL